jgi:hypothetical protein
MRVCGQRGNRRSSAVAQAGGIAASKWACRRQPMHFKLNVLLIAMTFGRTLSIRYNKNTPATKLSALAQAANTTSTQDDTEVAT